MFERFAIWEIRMTSFPNQNLANATPLAPDGAVPRPNVPGTRGRAPLPTLPEPGRSLNESTIELSRRLAEFGPETHRTEGFPHREFAELRHRGYYTITLPEGPLAAGRGHTAELLQVLKLVGRANLPTGRIYEGHVNAIELLHLYGTDAQRERYYADVRAGHLFGVWNTETHDGIHLYEQPDGRVRIEGHKSFCSGSVHVTRPIITGVLHRADGTEAGWQMVVVPLDRHDVPVDESFWTPLGMQCSVSHKIDFSGIMLEPEELLGAPDDYETQPHFSGGAIRFAAVHLGGAEALLDATAAFLRKVKRQENCYQKTRVGQMAIGVETGNLWLDRAGAVNDQHADPEHIIAYANMTRTVIADVCTEALQLAERSVGSRGLMHPGLLARLHTDLSMYLRQPAPDATLELVGQFNLKDDQSSHARYCGQRL